jgi:iron complex outermembrane receptor protein
MKKFRIAKRILPSLTALLLTAPGLVFAQEITEKEEREQKKITEEILVVGKDPGKLAVSTVTTLESTNIENQKPLDLSDAIKNAPGVFVTFGDKSVYTLKLRGIDSRRIALLIDGIPVYEPYYSTFDLKTVAAGGIDSIQLTKGPSSVLYGPNTLGGIVNVITRRPTGTPKLSFNSSYGEKNTRSLGLDTGYQWKNLAFAGTCLFQDSDGFYFPSKEDKTRVARSNSEYQRLNLNAKLYYTPSANTEILFNSGIYLSNYSMPPGLDTDRPRYWRFKNWDRYSFNAGGFTSIGKNSTLRFRGYYVQYDNTLDMFNDSEMTQRRFESTFDNSVYGLFTLADIYVSSRDSLKISMNYKRDKARIQDDVGEPWNEYDQGNFSLGFENHLTFLPKWQLVTGLSYDYLDKFEGEKISRLNPLVGIKYSLLEEMNLHLSYSKKSRFPSMRSMYSTSSGNPELLSETGDNVEFGFTFNKEFFLSGAVFLTKFKDMIDSVRLVDFTRRYFNIDKAHINGFEIQFQKYYEGIEGTVNYTYLSHENESDNRPLDAMPNHNLNFNLNIFPANRIRLGFTGMFASSSSWLDFNSGELLDIPSYFNLDSIISYQREHLELFIKATNIFNRYFYTEPGFPWRGRYFEFGIKLDVFGASR